MDKAQIVEIIRSNPQLPYGEVRRQALEAGLSRVDFDGAWTEANAKEENLEEHDLRVKEIQRETRRLGRETKTREEWKAYFKAKGYLDDECDLAYALEGAKINYGPLPPKLTIFLLVLLGIGIAFMLDPFMVSGRSSYGGYSHSRSDNDSGEVVYLAAAPVLGYIFFLRRQFQKYSWRIIENDFLAARLPEPSKNFSGWKRSGAEFLGRSDAKISLLFSTMYDHRPTHFGTYTYTTGSGKHRRTVECFMVVQKTKTQFPHVLAKKPLEEVSLLGRSSIQLEGVDFNKHYKVYAEKPTDAFYALNPRVMSALLESEVLSSLKSFETAGDLILMVFVDQPLDTGVHFSEPVIRYKDYQSVKSKLLAKLDLATDLNDVLSREIVDNGSKRSEAKIQ